MSNLPAEDGNSRRLPAVSRHQGKPTFGQFVSANSVTDIHSVPHAIKARISNANPPTPPNSIRSRRSICERCVCTSSIPATA